ncbi:DUF998 domain-containing protein [Embleya scabrispora]|uniref:DUF998 domain-containing protein n=1 Tax=Embleya scabrispora TaxID=159449 RepID=UPI00036E87A8|nr:DUF998 domain-containing protein [Embleya scabrispora]MYS82525.1 DUF998 domain-containing protein [Streptomyces sp. SID5474]
MIPRTADTAAALGGIVGGLAFSSFVTDLPSRSRLSMMGSYVSELSVAGRPASGRFRATDIVAGTGIVLLAAALARRMPPGRRRWSGCCALAAGGLASIVDGLLPMACAPSVDARCRARHRTGVVTQVADPHVVSSLAGFSALILGILLVAMIVRRLPAPGPWQRSGPIVAVLLATLGAAEVALGMNDTYGVGLLERIQILIISGWLCAAGVFLLRRTLTRKPTRERLPPPRPPGRPRAGRSSGTATPTPPNLHS